MNWLCSPGCRLARDTYRLTTVLRSKASIVLITGRRTAQGDPLRPSRLMFRLREEQIPARVLQFLKRDGGGSGGSSLASLGLQPGEHSQFTVPPEPVIELGSEGIARRGTHTVSRPCCTRRRRSSS